MTAAAEALGAALGDAGALAGALGAGLAGGFVATADALGLELVDEHAASEIASVMHAVERVQRRIRPSSSFPAPIAGRTERIRRGGWPNLRLDVEAYHRVSRDLKSHLERARSLLVSPVEATIMGSEGV